MNFNRLKHTIFVCSATVLFILCSGCGEQIVPADASAGSKTSQAIFSEVSSPKEVSSSAASSKPEVRPANSSAASSSAPNLPSVKPQAPNTVVPTSPEADASFLNDAVFIGDSVTLKLKNYVTYRRKTNPEFFGKAQFLAAGSMGSGNALRPLSPDSIHPLYNGEKNLLEDNAAKMGARKIYIMLGINDIAVYGLEGSAKNLEKLCLRFLEKQPQAELFIQSATPIIKNKQREFLNNRNLNLYNTNVSEFCSRHRWKYLDVASVMRAKDGSLKPEYCSDPDILGIHFTDEACNAWIHYILTHTGT